ANLARVRTLAPASRVVAVIKANAYGHGANRVLPAITDAEMLGVACLEEAIALRDAGAHQPNLLMEGVFEVDELGQCVRTGCTIAVHSADQLRMLQLTRLAHPVEVWLKLDSGMGRLGFPAEQAREVHARLRHCRTVGQNIGLMTHLANADMAGDGTT